MHVYCPMGKAFCASLLRRAPKPRVTYSYHGFEIGTRREAAM